MSRWPGRMITRNPVTPGGAAPTASAPGIWTLPEMAYWKKQGLWPDPSADPYWGYVSYLMATSSLSNASNNLFVDSSGAFNPIARVGNTNQGAITPYGTFWSNYFNGSSYLSVPNNSGFQFGTGDFTVECWVNRTVAANGSIVDVRSGGTGAVPWAFYIDASNFPYFYDGSFYTSSIAITLNTWNHIAIVRTSGTLKIFVNGVQGYSASHTVSLDATGSLLIGGTGAYSTGYISNVRVVKGTAIYTAAFTPPAAPLTAVSGTSILTCQGNRFRDASSNAATVTPNGSPQVLPFSPFVLSSPGISYSQSDISYWSGYFDGSGTLNFPANSAFDFGTGNFTMECWVRPTATGTVYLMGQTASNDYAPVLLYLTSGRPGIAVSPSNGTWTINSAVADALVLNAWTHLAVVRNGNKWSIYVNGVENVIAASTAVTPYTSSDPFGIGGEGVPGLNYPYYGNISDVRIVKGTAVYTSNFTPPTTPLTAISGTSLLTCQNAAFTDNSTNKFVATVSGTTTVTGNNPYQSGYYSNYFDGSGDGLSISSYSSSALAFGTGDFTIEFWAFATTAPNNNWTPFFTMGNSGGGQEIRIAQNINGTGFGWIYPNNTNNGDVYTGYGAMTTNTWHHIAMTRSGSTMRLFLDGAVVATGTGVSFNFTNTTLLRIGLPQPAYADGAFTGYLSNLRIVKGTAVYTAAFTPPTAPLTAISGTGLLTCQANRLIDSSSNAFALTKVGDTSVVPFDPFYTATPASNGGSMYFDGNGDYLSLASNPGFSIGTSTTPFTIEGWLYPTAAGGVVFNEVYTGPGDTISIAITMASSANSMDPTGGRYIAFGAYNGSSWTTAAYSSSQIQLNTWTHVACVFTGSTTKIFFNGVDVTAGSPASTWPVTGVAGNGWYVGRRWDTYADVYFSGYISDFRFTNGTAVYTSAFTPPTAPLTPSRNTVLLLNGMNGGIYDAAMQQNMETVGGAQVSSAQAKYGATSVYFDGVGDQLLGQTSPSLAFGTGDFTIEAWVYQTQRNSLSDITSCHNYGVAADWLWSINSSGNLYFQISSNSSGSQTSSSTVPLNTWTHVAVSRQNGTVRQFIAGTQVSSATYTTSVASTIRLSIGSASNLNANSTFYGYIDDLRITNGVARYTANFTPPTAALPVY